MRPTTPSVNRGWQAAADVVVVGSGVAGLTVAADTAAAGLRVVLLTKGAADEASTHWAQGGVAVVREERDPGDSVAAHIQDTLVAGVGLCDPAAVRLILTEGPAAVARLQARGAEFDAGPHGLLRTREGGHSANRVIHAGGDATGAEIERALLAVPGLPTVLTGHQVLDVATDETGRAAGVSVLAPDGTVSVVRTRAVVLATGGAGHLFSSTTNPAVATADGLAMALRVGASLADIEFLQFHPTVLWTGPGERGHRPLITEAVRGEGAVLIDATGARIMPGVHPLADLAPRDVVSLAITRRLAEKPGGVGDHVFLDATGIDPAVFAKRFPTVSQACALAGINPNTQPIPVAPAAHYHCGGINTDLHGRTDVPGLFAVGEVARTGLHGANRLASNSLLEGLVMGERAATAVLADESRPRGEVFVPAVTAEPAEAVPDRQASMSSYAGIGRRAGGLDRAMADMAHGTTDLARRETVEAANLRLVSRALLRAAAERTESRGCHVRTDFQDTETVWDSTVVVRLAGEEPTASVRDLGAATVPA